MNTIVEFNELKKKNLEILNTLKTLMTLSKDIGIQLDYEYYNKINKIKNTSENIILKVALIGGFSEGKTSIAAAWSEHYDKTQMKINQSESTDDVKIYNMGDFDLVDTPGLFGYKENENQEKYKDITKKYISEAHLILYVMNPNNPIKDSHKNILRWLFGDLKLLERTVFVLSRFDEEADIEDEIEYQERFEIKKENIVKRLYDLNIINKTTEDLVDVVAVSANPYGRGIEYYLKNLEEFKKISHINKLQDLTTKKIKSIDKNEMFLNQNFTIIKDILTQLSPKLDFSKNEILNQYDNYKSIVSKCEIEINNLKKILFKSRETLVDFVTHYFKNLAFEIDATDEDSFNLLIDTRIGNDNIIIQKDIKMKYEQILNQTIENMRMFMQRVDSYYKILSDNNKQILETLTKLTSANQNLKTFQQLAFIADSLPDINAIKEGSTNFVNQEKQILPSKVKSIQKVATIVSSTAIILNVVLEGIDKIRFENTKKRSLFNLTQLQNKLLNELLDDKIFIKNYYEEYDDLDTKIKKIKKKINNINTIKDQIDRCNSLLDIISKNIEEFY